MAELNDHDDIILIPCSGAEYNGELARQVAITLSEKSVIADHTSTLCLTIFMKHILLNENRLLEITKKKMEQSRVVIIDGCSGACVFKIFKNLNIKVDLVINLRKLFPKKTMNFRDIKAFLARPKMSDVKQEDIDKAIEYILNKLKVSQNQVT
ncbi:MAG: putative zinc-binding protein [Candidatus Helarchaeota archaeon]